MERRINAFYGATTCNWNDNLMASGFKVQIGDFCEKGHLIDGDNVLIRKRKSRNNDSVQCRRCQNAKKREARILSIPVIEAPEGPLTKRQEKSRAERYDKILAVEVQAGVAKYTGLNHLNLTKRAQRMWGPLSEAMDMHEAKCKDNPLPYIDYDFDDQVGLIPTASFAYQLCEGCPLLAECARFADAYKPVIGVWGGSVWKDGVRL
jgi:hypothetical protein